MATIRSTHGIATAKNAVRSAGIAAKSPGFDRTAHNRPGGFSHDSAAFPNGANATFGPVAIVDSNDTRTKLPVATPTGTGKSLNTRIAPPENSAASSPDTPNRVLSAWCTAPHSDPGPTPTSSNNIPIREIRCPTAHGNNHVCNRPAGNTVDVNPAASCSGLASIDTYPNRRATGSQN